MDDSKGRFIQAEDEKELREKAAQKAIPDAKTRPVFNALDALRGK